MPIEIKITGENGVHAAAEFRNLFAYMQSGVAIPIPGKDKPEASAPVEVVVPTSAAPAAPAAEKKTRKAKEEAKPEAAASKFTLQQAIDRAKEIAGDGKDEKVMTTLKGLNVKLGIAKVRELPADKIDGYMEELEKAFPKEGDEEDTTAEGLF